MFIPALDVVYQDRKVGASMVGLDLGGPVTDQVQFLVNANSEPCTGEIEIWSGDHIQPNLHSVKTFADRDILDVQGDMVDLQDLHRSGNLTMRNGLPS